MTETPQRRGCDKPGNKAEEGGPAREVEHAGLLYTVTVGSFMGRPSVWVQVFEAPFGTRKRRHLQSMAWPPEVAVMLMPWLAPLIGKSVNAESAEGAERGA